MHYGNHDTMCCEKGKQSMKSLDLRKTFVVLELYLLLL